MNERLYHSDSYCTTFDARVIERLALNGSPAVVLDHTAFYPTGGGQPHDTGTLNGMPVEDVVERAEDHTIIHVLTPDVVLETLFPNDQAHGEIDWGRRFDHMQQHTGQHILSQAFVQAIGVETIGFHMGGDFSTIDLGCDTLTDDDVARVEDLANQVVFQDRPIITRFVTQDEVASLPLRKPPPATKYSLGEASIRVVQIENFDWSACGGTHMVRTGEVGLIKVVRSERRGPETRITFLCGYRTLTHYRMLNMLTRDLAMRLTVGIEELPETVERIQAEARTARKERDRLRELLLDHEAVALISGAQVIGPASVVCKVFEVREVEEVRRLATRIASQTGHVALLGVKGEKAQIVFARSADLDYDMRPLLQEACRLVGGGGGGGPDLAQGGGPYPARLFEALQRANDLLRQQIERVR